MFAQLCRSCGATARLPAHKFHAALVECGLSFSTEEVSFVVGGRLDLDKPAWNTIAELFPPLIEALYDRLTMRSAVRSNIASTRSLSDDQVRALRQSLRELEDEERQLLSQQVLVRGKISDVQRRLRDEEERIAAAQRDAENLHRTPAEGTGERQRELQMLQKYIALRMRQSKLKQEEAHINHQLNLL